MNYTSIVRNIVLLTECISTFFVVPITSFFIVYFVVPNQDQYAPLIWGIGIGIFFYIFPLFAMYKGNYEDLKKLIQSHMEDTALPDSHCKQYWNSFVNLPAKLATQQGIRWILGSTITTVYFLLQTKVSGTQVYYLVATLCFSTLLTVLVTYIATENFLKKASEDLFSKRIIALSDQTILFRKITISIPIILSITVVLFSIIYTMFSAKRNQKILLTHLKDTGVSLDTIQDSLIGFIGTQTSLSIFFMFLVSFFFYYYIKSRLETLTKANKILKNISQGKLNQKAVMKFPDEIGQLIVSVNRTLVQLSNIISENKSLSESVASSTKEMNLSLDSLTNNIQSQAASAEEVSASIQEINANLDGTKERAEFQGKNMSELKAGIQSLSDSNQEIRIDIRKAFEEAVKMSENSNIGKSSLETMKSSMEKISYSSKEMRKVMGIINSIFSQINLLALNAAIEAARAGDYGMGFSVVADEIGKLASKTAISIQDTEKLIKNNELEISNGSEIIKKTGNIFQILITSIESFQKIIDTVYKNAESQISINEKVIQSTENVYTVYKAVLHSTNELKTASKEIEEAIHSLNDSIQTSAAGMEELSAVSNGIENLAKNMDEKISRFELV